MKFIPEKMNPNYGEDVYEKVSEITKLKFKGLIKDSGIEFKQIYQMTDLITQKQNYVIFTNADSIFFNDRTEFIQAFIEWLKKSISNFNAEYEELLVRQNQAIVDDNLIYLENERIGHNGNKQLKLLNKMRELRTEIPNPNK